VPRPKPLDTNRAEGVVIRRYSGENWIVIAATPDQVWPRIRDYWAGQGIQLDYENPVDGVMETVWQDAPDDASRQEKYRLLIEPGIHAGSSEIILIQISRPTDEVARGLVVWPRVSDSEDREFAILQQVSQYLADRTDIYSSSSSSLLAGSIQADAKASLIENRASGPVLELRISMTRAWVQVGQALQNAEVSIVTSDRDEAFYQVEFAGLNADENRPGFFRRVFTSDDEEAQQVSFRVRLEESPAGIQVTATPQEGEGDTGSSLDTELLQAILNNLS
jgi:outer membrane protein assembly factor BamC